MKRGRKKQIGAALVFALAASVITLLVGLTLTTLSIMQRKISHAQSEGIISYYLAESGIEHGKVLLEKGAVPSFPYALPTPEPVIASQDNSMVGTYSFRIEKLMGAPPSFRITSTGFARGLGSRRQLVAVVKKEYTYNYGLFIEDGADSIVAQTQDPQLHQVYWDGQLASYGRIYYNNSDIRVDKGAPLFKSPVNVFGNKIGGGNLNRAYGGFFPNSPKLSPPVLTPIPTLRAMAQASGIYILGDARITFHSNGAIHLNVQTPSFAGYTVSNGKDVNYFVSDSYILINGMRLNTPFDMVTSPVLAFYWPSIPLIFVDGNVEIVADTNATLATAAWNFLTTPQPKGSSIFGKWTLVAGWPDDSYLFDAATRLPKPRLADTFGQIGSPPAVALAPGPRLTARKTHWLNSFHGLMDQQLMGPAFAEKGGKGKPKSTTWTQYGQWVDEKIAKDPDYVPVYADAPSDAPSNPMEGKPAGWTWTNYGIWIDGEIAMGNLDKKWSPPFREESPSPSPSPSPSSSPSPSPTPSDTATTDPPPPPPPGNGFTAPADRFATFGNIYIMDNIWYATNHQPDLNDSNTRNPYPNPSAGNNNMLGLMAEEYIVLGAQSPGVEKSTLVMEAVMTSLHRNVCYDWGDVTGDGSMNNGKFLLYGSIFGRYADIEGADQPDQIFGFNVTDPNNTGFRKQKFLYDPNIDKFFPPYFFQWDVNGKFFTLIQDDTSAVK